MKYLKETLSGKEVAVSEDWKYIIFPFLDDFRFTSLENYNNRIQDGNKVLKFNRYDGFETLVDCIEYAEKYL